MLAKRNLMMADIISKNRNYILFSLLLILIYFPIFLHLTALPIRMWDESITGCNAIQMAANHNYIVTYISNGPDMYNCKPPLLLWCIVFFIKVMGFSELSLRLPSALAAVVLCIYLFYVLKKYTHSTVFPFFTVLILVTCQGYIRNHVTRTGEYDATLTLFTTIASFHLFFATEATEKKEESKHLVWLFVFMTLAVLTKGIACLMFAPGFFIYALLRKKIVPFLKNRGFYAGLLIFIVFGAGFYLLREAVNPGYLNAVWINELGGRFSCVNEGHVATFNFYVNEIITWQFIEYLPVFPLALIVSIFLSETFIRRLVVFALVTGGTFLVVISSAATKLSHYDAPLFPFLAITTAPLFYLVFRLISEKLKITYHSAIAPLIAFIVVLSLFIKPYSDIIDKVYFPKGDWWEEGFSTSCKYFQQAVAGKAKNENCKLIFDAEPLGPGTTLDCYKEELKEHNIPNLIVRHDQVQVHDSIIVFDSYLKQLIEKKYVTEQIRTLDFCKGDIIYLACEK
jgi:4-amino-4-deoxy-L-arabinose transferase-like glycosyltransferase